MDRLPLLFWMSLFMFLLIAMPSVTLAGDLEVLAEEMKPVSGYVVMPINGEFLIDLDASQGLQVGDLLSVGGTPEKIVHPVTKEVLGTLNTPKAVLKVTRLDSGFSHARSVSGSTDLAKGEPVRRFAGLTAALYAPPGQGEQVYDRLHDLLPELVWQGRFRSRTEAFEGASDIDVRFVLAGSELRLLDRHGEQFRAYSVPTPVGQTAATTPSRPAIGTGLPDRPAAGGVEETAPGTLGGIDFGDAKLLAEFPGQVKMAAFHRVSNRLFVATVAGTWLRVYEVSDRLRPAGATKIRDGSALPLTVSWWQPDQSGPLYLAVTASVVTMKSYGNIQETSMGGAVYEWDGKVLAPVVPMAPYFLETLDRNGDGQPEILLGQEFDWQRVFGPIYELTMENKTLARRQAPFPLPKKFILPGSNTGDLDGDGRSELISVSRGELKIFSGGKMVYKSPGHMGGSLVSMTYDVNPGITDTLFNTVSLDIPPAVHDIDGDGADELLVVASDTSGLNVPGIGPGINSSWVAVIMCRNGIYQKGRLRFASEHPLQGLWVEDDQVYLVETQTTSLMGQEGSSRLLAVPLSPRRP